MDQVRAEIYAHGASKNPDPVRLLTVVLQKTDLVLCSPHLSKDLGCLLSLYKMDVGKGRRTLEKLCYCPLLWGSILLFREGGCTPSSSQHPFYSISTEFQPWGDDSLLERGAITKTQDFMCFLL